MHSLESIKGFGPVRLKALAARGIETALDLVETLPVTRTRRVRFPRRR